MWNKEDIVKIFKNTLSDLTHVEMNKNLDQKMYIDFRYIIKFNKYFITFPFLILVIIVLKFTGEGKVFYFQKNWIKW